ncbi:hypothetical protein [Nocardia sp. NPDC051750]|uniref:hypothetical protein n=1 Tax=Nocardia sp. NPDC051750 TaxID=3364325 RepID=UPI0037914169
MNSRFVRPFVIAGLVLSAGAFGAGSAAAAAPAAAPAAAAPVTGSVELCLNIPLGPLELGICL